MGTVWERMRRRKLFQWGVAYLAGAFAALQVLDLLVEPFGWPASTMRMATVVLAMGLVAALVIAWYHGEQGRQRTSTVELLMLAGILLTAGAAISLVKPPQAVPEPTGPGAAGAETGGAEPDPRSIAVLPFVNMSGDADNEYFSDGMTEEILNALAQIEGLQVAARTSAFAFKGASQDVREVGRALNVAHVLEGSVRKSGSRLRITGQLIDVRNGYHIWSQSYDREFSASDVFAVQDEIAHAIADALQVTLGDDQDRTLVRGGTADIEAYELYLRGRFHWNVRTGPALERAAEMFERALSRDPDFALAHAGLADAYTLFPTYDVASPDAAYPRARDAARRALELDPGLAEPHAALGFIKTHYEHDWPGAEAEFREAIRIRPGYATAHQWFRLPLVAQGRFDEAIAEAGRARQLDPLSPIVTLAEGTPHHYARRYDEALVRYRNVLEIDPSFVRAHSEMGDVLLHLGRDAEALAAHRRAVELSGGSPRYLARLGYLYGQTGNVSEAREILLALTEARATGGYVSPYIIAITHMGLGETAAALEWLERSVAESDSWAIYIAVDPVFDTLRGEPTFERLLARMGLEEVGPFG